MGSSDALRAHAAYCLGKAQAAQNEPDKALWAGMAQAWLRLAQDAERIRQNFEALESPADADGEG